VCEVNRNLLICEALEVKGEAHAQRGHRALIAVKLDHVFRLTAARVS
jgi:hypothetical protein